MIACAQMSTLLRLVPLPMLSLLSQPSPIRLIHQQLNQKATPRPQLFGMQARLLVDTAIAIRTLLTTVSFEIVIKLKYVQQKQRTSEDLSFTSIVQPYYIGLPNLYYVNRVKVYYAMLKLLQSHNYFRQRQYNTIQDCRS